MDSEKSGARRGPSGLEALYLMLMLAALVAAAKLPLGAAEPAEIFLGRVFMGFLAIRVGGGLGGRERVGERGARGGAALGSEAAVGVAVAGERALVDARD